MRGRCWTGQPQSFGTWNKDADFYLFLSFMLEIDQMCPKPSLGWFLYNFVAMNGVCWTQTTLDSYHPINCTCSLVHILGHHNPLSSMNEYELHTLWFLTCHMCIKMVLKTHFHIASYNNAIIYISLVLSSSTPGEVQCG